MEYAEEEGLLPSFFASLHEGALLIVDAEAMAVVVQCALEFIGRVTLQALSQVFESRFKPVEADRLEQVDAGSMHIVLCTVMLTAHHHKAHLRMPAVFAGQGRLGFVFESITGSESMVRHIVMWKLRDRADAALLKEQLEAMRGRIPGLLNIEAGIDFLASEQSADLVLVADLESREALDAYQAHPAHQVVVPLIRQAAVSRTVADYET